MQNDDILLISEVFRFPHKKYYWQMNFFKPKIYMFNWQEKKIIKKLTAPAAYFDMGEYEFLRLCYHYSGARGITSNDKYIFIALQDAIAVYDPRLQKQIGRIDHRLFNGIHEIYWHDDRLYITCAVTDSILVMSEEGKELAHFFLGNNPYFIENLGLSSRELDNRLDYRLMHRVKRLFHVNNVQVVGKNIYANFNLQGCFAKIYPQEEIIICDPALRQSHNGQFSPDGQYILINDTCNYKLRVYDPQGKPIKSIDFRKFLLPVNFNDKKVFGHGHDIKAGWLRGMAFSGHDKEIVYAGLSPAMVVAINYISGELSDYFQFRRNTWMSIHGLHNLAQPTHAIIGT
ncbi:MAG: hypothetical protein MUF15_14460 [Acidobacteria bacterium]|jgi:hypothetical protein|nr:hypothetical protein [Acidobacteriota bacterium]